VKFSDIDARVSQAEAVTEGCPKCGAARGAWCTYVTDIPATSRIRWRNPGNAETEWLHRKGDLLESGRAHSERIALIRAKRLREWRSWSRRGRQAVAAMPDDLRAAAAAMRAWDVAEYNALRDWLAEHGHLLVNANRMRPDGTARGESYARIQAEREIDQAFE
jgi:hypothetical protein